MWINLNTIVNLYSEKKGEIKRFLNKYYDKDIVLENDLKWEKEFENPIEITNIISALIDNNSKFKINTWISLDIGIFINVTETNLDQIIRYLFERYPY